MTIPSPTDEGAFQGSTLWRWYGAGALLLLALYFAAPFGPSQTVIYSGCGLAAVASLVTGVRRYRPPQPTPWLLIATGLLLMVTGDGMWAAYEHLEGGDPPFPWYADIVYLISYPVIAAGFVRLVRIRNPLNDREALIDGLAVAVGAGAVSWVFLIDPYLHDETLGLVARLVAIAYPLMDLVLLAVAIRFLTAGGFRQPALSLLLAGAGLLLLSDVIYGRAVLAGAYASGDPVDAGWLLSYAAFGVAALHPSMRAVGRQAEPRAATRLSPGRLSLLGVVALAGPTVLEVRQLQGADRAEIPVLVAASAVLFLLALARVGGLAFRLNAALDERASAEAQLQESEARFRGAFVHAPIGMALVGGDGRWLQVNRALCEMLDYAEDELLSMSWMDVAHPDDIDGHGYQRRLESGEVAEYELDRRFVRRGGQIVSTVQRVSLLRHAGDGVAHAVWQIQDVSGRKALEADLRRLALHDPLTGLPNRTLFGDRLARALTGNREQRLVAVLFLDLDRFKLVNDSLGHAAGDRLLATAAVRLTESLRAGDTLARFGGDEFVVLLEGIDRPEAASEVAERLLEVARAPYRLEGQDAVVGASIGIAVGRAGVVGADELLRQADMALYRAKASGRDSYALFDPVMLEESARRLALETDLRRAVERGELVLRYQPIVDLRDGRVVGAEALVRWVHPARGLISPGEFIDLAEETGLIVPLGTWVLGEACRQAAAWRAADRSAEPVIISVNVSSRQVRDPALVATVADVLRSTGLPPAALQLELTERVLVENDESTAAVLTALTELGVRLAIDDFGTGYSSLGSLRHLPVAVLKLDRTFVAGLGHNAGGDALVDAVASLARALDLAITAEGIETEAHLAGVRAAGCDLGQGYLFGPPVPAEAFEMHLSAGRVALPPAVPGIAPATA